MPIVLHPTSCCDICLDDYTWVTPKNSPHAISCGHVFCGVCLDQLSPSSCPLCRKNFSADRVKKLHVDKAPAEEDGTNHLLDSHANLLLQRIALVSGDRAPEEDVVEVITEVNVWLESQSDHLSANRPLHAAVKALGKNRILREKYIKKRDALVEKDNDLERLRSMAESDLQTARILEGQLLTQIDQITDDFSAKLQDTESRMNALRDELARYKNPHNPLPAPPEPLNVNLLPSYNWQSAQNHVVIQKQNGQVNGTYQPANPAAGASTNPKANGQYPEPKTYVPNGTYVNTLPLIDGTTNGQPQNNTRRDTNGRAVETTNSRNINGNGSTHTHAMIQPPSVPPAPTKVTSKGGERNSRPSSGNKSRRDASVDGRGQSNGISPSNSQSQSRQPVNTQPLQISQSRSSDIDLNGNPNDRVRVKPGAPPAQRVVPPRVPPLPKYMRDDDSDDETNRHPMQTRESQRSDDRDSRRSDDRHRPSVTGTVPPTRVDDTAWGPPVGNGMADDVEGRLISASAYVHGYASGFDEGFGYTAGFGNGNGYEYPLQTTGFTPQRRPPMEVSSGSGLGLVGVPGSMIVANIPAHDSPDLSDITTPRPRAAQAQPLGAVAANGSDWDTNGLLIARRTNSASQGVHRTLEQVMRSDVNPQSRQPRTRDAQPNPPSQANSIRNSIDSNAGSVSTWGTVSTRGSLNELGGLIGLQRANRGPGYADGSFTAPLFGRDLDSDAEADGTPRLGRGQALPLGFTAPRSIRSQGYASDDERPRHARSFSQTDVPALMNEHPSGDDEDEDEPLRPHHSRRHSLAQSVSLDSGNLPPFSYGSTPADNGLGLTFDTSAAGNDRSTAFAVDASGSTHEQIRAPAPRINGPNVLTLWRSGA